MRIMEALKEPALSVDTSLPLAARTSGCRRRPAVACEAWQCEAKAKAKGRRRRREEDVQTTVGSLSGAGSEA